MALNQCKKFYIIFSKKLKDLAKAHENLCIDDIQFDAFCEVLEGSLIEHGIDDEGVRELFIFIEP